jgi:hypothetical protein
MQIAQHFKGLEHLQALLLEKVSRNDPLPSSKTTVLVNCFYMNTNWLVDIISTPMISSGHLGNLPSTPL